MSSYCPKLCADRNKDDSDIDSKDKRFKDGKQYTSKACFSRSVRIKTEGEAKSYHLPLEIMVEILKGLPVKSLVRFKCVCKEWYSIISDDPEFAKSHYTRSLTRPGGTSLLISFPESLGRIIFTATHKEEKGEPLNALNQFTLPGVVTTYISESLNGLICFDMNNKVQICNPSTRKTITLPPTNPIAQSNDSSCVNLFGFDPSTNQHKVLTIWTSKMATGYGHGDYKTIVEHMVLTLGSNWSWRRIQGAAPSYEPKSESVCLNGTMYYRCMKRRFHDPFTDPKMSIDGINRLFFRQANRSIDEVLVAFNLGNEGFSVIPLPTDAYSALYELALIQCGGQLALVDYSLFEFQKMRMWILEDDCQSWVPRDIAIPVSCLFRGLSPFGILFPGLTYPQGKESPDTTTFVRYQDIKSNAVRSVKVTGLPDYIFMLPDVKQYDYVCISVTNHVESLLSLPQLNSCNH